MSVKAQNVVAHIESKGRAIIKLDRSAGVSQITITRREFNRYVVGTHPGSIIRSLTRAEMVNLLNDNSLYINSWS